jgi:hypothetical protein
MRTRLYPAFLIILLTAAALIAAGSDKTFDKTSLLQKTATAIEASIATGETAIPDPPVADLATACKRLRIKANGVVGHFPHYAFDYIDECDTFNFRNDAEYYQYGMSPVVLWLDGDDTISHAGLYADEGFGVPRGYIDAANLVIDETSAYNYVRTESMTSVDSALQFIAEYYAPKDPYSCEFMIEKLRFFNRTEELLEDVIVGVIKDWDVPSDTSPYNGSGFDEQRMLLYQSGVEYGQDDGYEAMMLAECGYAQEEDDRFAGMAFGPYTYYRSMATISIEPAYEVGYFPPGYLYRQLHYATGYLPFTSVHPDSQYIDLVSLVRLNTFDLQPHDTQCVTVVLVGTRDGLGVLQDALDEAQQFMIDQHILCPEYTCCTVPGDANGNGRFDISDAVAIVNIVFKQGAPSPCCAAADANYDCSMNISDAVWMLGYVFKGGPPPLCGCAGNHPCPF